MVGDFGAKLSELRATLGLTQVEMAKVMGIGEKMYYKYEKGAYTGSPKRQAKYLQLIETYQARTADNSKVYEPQETYQVTLHEPPSAHRQKIPPERSDGEAVHILVIANSKQTDIIDKQQATIDRLLKRIEILEKWEAGLSPYFPKTQAG